MSASLNFHVGTAAPGCPSERNSPGSSFCPSFALKSGGASPRWTAEGGCPLRRLCSIQEILPIQRVPLRRTKARIAYDAPQLFFGCAVVHTRGADDVLLQHHGAHVVAAEAQAHLADFQSLGHPTGLHVQKIRKIEPRN